MAKNLVKDKVMEMVKRQVKHLEGAEISWPDHSIAFLGRVGAGSGQLRLKDIDDSETDISIKTQSGPRWFKVKVTEIY